MGIEEAIRLIRLAREKQDLGVHEQAIILFEQAIALLRNLKPTPHKYIAIALNDLGLLQYRLGAYQEALATFSSALTHQDGRSAQLQIDIAATQNNLGLVFKAMKNYAEAETYYKRAAHNYRATGNKTADAANNLSNLGQVYEALGQHEKAYAFFQDSLHLAERYLDQVHPQKAVTLYNLAALCTVNWTRSHLSPLALMMEANAIDDQLIDKIFKGNSETGRLRFLGTRFAHYHIFLSYTVHLLQNQQEAPIQAAYQLVLRRKGLATEISANKQTAVWRKKHPASAALLNQLSLLRQEIAQKTINSSGPTEEIAALIKKKEALEAKLARDVPAISIHRELSQISHRDISKKLPPKSALVEFVRVETYNFSAVLSNGDDRNHPPRYLAFVILASQPDELQLFDLGPAADIEKQVNDIGYRLEQAGRETHEIVDDWLRLPPLDPIWTALSACKNLFIAPDGDLALLSLAILQQSNGRYLVEDFTISYVMTGRDIFFSQPRRQNSSENLIVTDPDFNLGLPESHSAADLFDPLNTAVEHWGKIEAILKTKSVTGQEATAQVMKEIKSPKILHLNTHGFFFRYKDPNERHQDPSEMRLPVRLQRLREHKNALLRGGLAFAGANRWARGLAITDPPGSGILTAEEIRNLNFTNCDLIVLSACDTGVGDALAGEAVFGFRRAITIAGAKTLVMSLWQVPVKFTPTLMYYFYEYLQAKLPCAEALRKAQLDLKNINGVGVLGWGAFICQGNTDAIFV